MNLGFVLLFAAVAGMVVARIWAGRRAAAGDTRYVWLFYLPLAFGGAVFIWAGVRMAADLPAAGIVLALVGTVTLVLVARLMRSGSVSGVLTDGDVPGPYLDYIVWAVVGAPILLVVLLLVLVIADRLN